MWSDKRVRNSLCLGYTFMFKGEYCYITKLYTRYFEYSTTERPTNNYMYYGFFQTIPHFKSKYKVGKQKSLDFEPGFLPLVDKIVNQIREGKSPNQKIYML